MDVTTEILAGNRRTLARLITHIENQSAGAADALAALFPHSGHAHLIGVTGAPGTGKSSLVAKLAAALRTEGQTVAILAVDPTSPFTGGAILGDRIRMRELSGDPGVFIRSMATRGDLGGLARAADNAITVMDAAGFDVVLIETVGAGQSEVEIARHAHTVIVVEAPGFGDDVQAIKAGILETADILAVNKADDPRAANTERALRAMLELGRITGQARLMHHGRLLDAEVQAGKAGEPDGTGWDVPVVLTNALTGDGVAELVQRIHQHQAYLRQSGELAVRERTRIRAELERLLRDALFDRLFDRIGPGELDHIVGRVTAREVTPEAAVRLLLTHLEQPEIDER